MNIVLKPIITSPSMPKIQFSGWKQIPIWLIIIALWGLLTISLISIAFFRAGALYDFSAYLSAAHRLNHGLDLYIPNEAFQTYLYPPLLAHLLVPLDASMSFGEVAAVWTIFSLLCVILSIFLLATQVGNGWKHYLVWFMPVVFAPILETYMQGQIVSIMLLLVVGSMVAYKTNNRILAGGLLALATWFKVYPIIIILYFALRKEWKVVISAFIVGMILLFFQISWSGLDTMMGYFTGTLVDLTVHGQTFNMFHNHSLLGLGHRLFENNSQLMSINRWILIGVMIITMWKVSYRSSSKKSSNMRSMEFELEYAMIITFMMLIGGTLFASGMLPILVAVAIALKYGQSKRDYVVVLITFMGMVLTFFIFFEDTFKNQSPIIQGYGTYSVILLWVQLAYMRWKAQNWIQE